MRKYNDMYKYHQWRIRISQAGEGGCLLFSSSFPENCMEMKKFWLRTGPWCPHPLDPPIMMMVYLLPWHNIMLVIWFTGQGNFLKDLIYADFRGFWYYFCTLEIILMLSTFTSVWDKFLSCHIWMNLTFKNVTQK